jgi:hypothetical protein
MFAWMGVMFTEGLKAPAVAAATCESVSIQNTCQEAKKLNDQQQHQKECVQIGGG